MWTAAAAAVPLLVLTASLVVFAPTIIGVIYGDAFVEASVPILRTLALVIPIGFVGSLCGVWLITQHRDRACTVIVLSAGLFNIALGTVLTLSDGPIGMAWSVVTAEAVAALGALFVVTRDGHKRRVAAQSRSPSHDAVVDGLGR